MQVKKALTKRQKVVLNFIVHSISKNGYAPSLLEIAKFLGTDNTSTAQYFVQELESKGYLKKKSNIARGISTLSSSVTVPLLGFIAAGDPIEPIENPEEVEVPYNISIDGRYPHYALKVKGDSMIDMGILDQDLILIKHQLTAQNGDIVVAITENGATLKVYRNQGGKIILEPRNKNYPTIRPNYLEIRGKFIGLLRGGE